LERDLFQKYCERDLHRVGYFPFLYKHVHLRVAKALFIPLMHVKAKIETV